MCPRINFVNKPEAVWKLTVLAFGKTGLPRHRAENGLPPNMDYRHASPAPVSRGPLRHFFLYSFAFQVLSCRSLPLMDDGEREIPATFGRC